MPSIYSLEQIKDTFDIAAARAAVERALQRHASGAMTMPPPDSVGFAAPPGEAHVHYGFVHGAAHFVVMTRTAFEPDAEQPLRRDGATLMFKRLTGELDAILLDAGWLSRVRAALTGSIVAKHLSPEKVSRIGVLGTGDQARLQIQFLDDVVDCRNILVWGRRADARHAYAADMRAAGYNVDTTADPQTIAACELIITTTASQVPLLKRVLPGSHITAVGADTPDKQELEPVLFERAGLIVADSVEQCLRRGELHHVGPELDIDSIVPLGELVGGAHRGRTNADVITVADLTGLAVQDVEIAAAVLASIRGS